MEDEGDKVLITPENFSMVESGVYRSAFPRQKSTRFLESIKLKCVVSLVPEAYPESMVQFYNSQGVNLRQYGLQGNKDLNKINIDDLILALFDVLDSNNHPVLIHCNKGMHRTGCLVGCLRKLRNWDDSSIFAEYVLFSSPRDRVEDQTFIEEFDVERFWRKHKALKE